MNITATNFTESAINTQSQPCPLCGGMRSTRFDQRIVQGKTITNRRCANCGLVFQSPRMTDEELDAFYSAEYRRLYQGSAEPNAKDLLVQSRRATSLRKIVQSQLTSVTRHLDIGSSAGLLLQEIRDAYACESVGIEPGEAYREYARKQGLQVFESLEAMRQEFGAERRFDLISMAHVLEHLPAPVDYLRSIREEWLQPDGCLLVEVPNLYAHDSFEIAHLVSYSAHTLRQVLESGGFEITTLEQHGRPRSELLPLYLTALGRPAAARQEVAPERFVWIKRRAGMLRRYVLTRTSPRKAWVPVKNSGRRKP